jgi:flagellar L-ring protein FlgH
MLRRLVIAGMALLLSVQPSVARGRKAKSKSLEEYLARVQAASVAPQSQFAAGSLWDSSGLYADLGADYKARKVGDLIVIRITEQMLSQSSASVASQRKLAADSGISALPGKINTSGIENLFSPHSNQSLQGQGQTSSKSLLQTSISGRVVALLPGNGLVVEAERTVLVDNQRQNVIVRGVARMADVTQDNAILSTQLSNLEVEVVGKGVISDGTRPPNFVVRLLLRILGL